MQHTEACKSSGKGWLMMEETQPKLQPLIICSHLIFHHYCSSCFPSMKGFGMEAQVPGSAVTSKVQLSDKFFGDSGRKSLTGTTVWTVAEEKMKPHIRGSSVMICCVLKNWLCPRKFTLSRPNPVPEVWHRLLKQAVKQIFVLHEAQCPCWVHPLHSKPF